MSSAERKEKDREDTSEWIECEMSMMYLLCDERIR